MSEVKDFCNQPRVAHTGMGWGVRIDGTDVFESLNEYGFKTLRTLEIVTGLSSEQEAKAYLTQWLSEQLPDFDAQRLRANTAEAESVASHQREARLQEMVNDLSDELYLVAEERDHAKRNSSAFEDRMGNLQVSNGKLQDKLAAAEQRIAEHLKVFDTALFRLETFIEAEREMPIPTMEVLLDAIRGQFAALNPNPEAEGHE